MTISGSYPVDAYLAQCHLCLEIRKFSAGESSLNSDELKPGGLCENLQADFTNTEGDENRWTFSSIPEELR